MILSVLANIRFFLAAILVILCVLAGLPVNGDELTGGTVALVDGEEESAIFVPTPQDVVEKMLEVGKVTSGDLLFDLGCGDGRILVAAAKIHGCRAKGYDISERKVRQSKENVKRHGLEERVDIEQRDIFTLDLTMATVVTLYLLPEMNDQLVPQLKRMKDGSRILCHEFAIDAYEPDRVVQLKSTYDDTSHDIYLRNSRRASLLVVFVAVG